MIKQPKTKIILIHGRYSLTKEFYKEESKAHKQNTKLFPIV